MKHSLAFGFSLSKLWRGLKTGMICAGLMGAVLLPKTVCAQPPPQFAQDFSLDTNLYSMKARLDVYFDSLRLVLPDSVFYAEGSEYDRFQEFLAFWEPRLSGHGSFRRYYQALNAFYNNSTSSVSPLSISALNSTQWQEIGPTQRPQQGGGGSARGIGIINFITFFDANPQYMLCGSQRGGLFYSGSGGNSWQNAGTDKWPQSGCSSAVFHPADNKTWFASNSGWIMYSGGIWRTTNEGLLWDQIADYTDFTIPSAWSGVWTTIYKVVIDPITPNTLYAVTSCGIFKTTDANVASPTWTPLTSVSGGDVRAYDLEMKPNDPLTLYATVGNWTSNVWQFMRSMDGGLNWNALPGQPPNTATAKLLTIEVSKADPNLLYCVIGRGGSPNSELWIFNNFTSTWPGTPVVSNLLITFGGGNGFGINQINANEIFVSSGFYGAEAVRIRTNPLSVYPMPSAYSCGGCYHPDVEDFVGHPTNTNEIWMANHGGVWKSIDNGTTWQDMSNGLGVAMTLAMATSFTNPELILLGLDHDGSVLTTSPYTTNWNPSWKTVMGGDGLRCLIDNTNPQYMWVSHQSYTQYLSINGGNSFSSLPNCSPFWISAMVSNKQNPSTIYRVIDPDCNTNTGNDHIIKRSIDRGITNVTISSFQSIYSTYIIWNVFTPYTNGNYLLAHVISDQGTPTEKHHLWRTTDANNINTATVIASWVELSLPRNAWFSDVEFDPTNPDIVYLAYSSSSLGSPSLAGTQMVFKVDYTTPSGISQDLTSNLPNIAMGQDALALEKGSYVGSMYLATDVGVFYTNDQFLVNGTNWQILGTDLPHVTAQGLEINYQINKIRIGTHGRGGWERELFSPPCIPPPVGVVSWWPFDETQQTGSPAHDIAGVDNAATWINNPVPVSGMVGGALSFNGTNYVEAANHAELNFGKGNFSIDVWVQSSDATGVRLILDKRTGVSPLVNIRGYDFYLFNGRPGLQLADGTFTNYNSSGAGSFVADGNWHHIAVTVERNNASGLLFYVDGAQVSMLNPTAHTGDLNNTATIRIAGHQVSGAAFTGTLDELEIHKGVVLTPGQIQTLYLAGSVGKCKEYGKRAKICGVKWRDYAPFGVRNPYDPVRPNWTIYLSICPPNLPYSIIATAQTDASGSYCFSGLYAGNYCVVERQYFGWSQTWPTSVYHSFILQSGQQLSGIDFGNRKWWIWPPTVLIKDSLQWIAATQPITHEDRIAVWDTARIEPLPLKIAKLDPYQVVFNGIFDPEIDTLPPFGPGTYSIHTINTSKSNTYRVFVNDSLRDGQPDSVVVTLSGGEDEGYTITFVRLETPDTTLKFRTFTADQLAQDDQAKPNKRKPGILPNTANVVIEITKQQKGALIVGEKGKTTADGKEKGYLQPVNQSDVYKTFNAKGVRHTGNPHGLDFFNGGTKLILKRQKSLPAIKHNNRFLANLLALKINILASQLGKTPQGFGELVYVPIGGTPWFDPNGPGCPVNMIAQIADSIMTKWESVPYSKYDDINGVLEMINAAFAKQLPFSAEDTVSWVSGAKLALTGAKALADVPFLLKVEGGALPRIRPAPPTAEQQSPDVFTLGQNYPNPFNPTTTIEFSLQEQAYVSLKVYNVLGQEVKTLLNHELLDDGSQEVEFDASSLASGVYFYRLVAEAIGDEEEGTPGQTYVSVKKMLLMK